MKYCTCLFNGCFKLVLIASIQLVFADIANAQFKEGITLETSVTGDFVHNLKGGIDNKYVYLGMEDVAISFDFEKMGWWNGGELFLQGLNTHGALPSEELVGDLQVSSNIESGNYTGLYQYYYKHTLGRSSFLIGQHDLNSDFVGTEYGGTFINSSFGIAPTISLNVPVSIYPMAALALCYKYEVPYKFNYKLGIYDGDPGDIESNRYNLQPNISQLEGALIISEFELLRQVNDLPENYKIGVYYHTNDFVDYEDTLKTRKGNYGAYFVSDIVLWSGFNHPDSYLGLFLQSGVAPSVINQVDFYLGGGFHLNGILPNRFEDAVGLAFAYAGISKPYRQLNLPMQNGEWCFELTYKISVFEHYTIQPNLQYIVNPGANTALDNALVLDIRFGIFLENH